MRRRLHLLRLKAVQSECEFVPVGDPEVRVLVLRCVEAVAVIFVSAISEFALEIEYDE